MKLLATPKLIDRSKWLIVHCLLPIVYIVKLTMLIKKDEDIRPIAVEKTSWKNDSCFGIRNDLTQSFNPAQVSFGIKGGGLSQILMNIFNFDYKNSYIDCKSKTQYTISVQVRIWTQLCICYATNNYPTVTTLST